MIDTNSARYLQGFTSGLKHGHLKGRVAFGTKAENDDWRAGETAGGTLRFKIKVFMVNSGKGGLADEAVKKIVARAEADAEYMAYLMSGAHGL